MQGSKPKNFTESKAWQEGHKLVLTTYRFLQKFPAEEEFSLKSQLQRSAVSITTNLAEGSAAVSRSERLKFFVMANASMIEFQNCLFISHDVGLLKTPFFDEIARQAAIVNRQLMTLIAAAQKAD